MSSETIPTIKSLIFTFPKTAVNLKLCCYCPQSLLLTSRTVRWKMLPLDFLLLLHHGRILQHILWLSVFVFLGGLRFTICMKMVDLFVVHLGNWRMNLCLLFGAVNCMECELHSCFLFRCNCFFCVIKQENAQNNILHFHFLVSMVTEIQLCILFYFLRYDLVPNEGLNCF